MHELLNYFPSINVITKPICLAIRNRLLNNVAVGLWCIKWTPINKQMNGAQRRKQFLCFTAWNYHNLYSVGVFMLLTSTLIKSKQPVAERKCCKDQNISSTYCIHMQNSSRFIRTEHFDNHYTRLIDNH